MTAKEKILFRLRESSIPLPIHALDISGVSQTSASARLREMARDNLVRSVPVPGKRFTAWAIVPHDLTLPLK